MSFDLVRTMTCYLRTRLSLAEAHEKLDPWRRQRMFVKRMHQHGEWTEVELQLWHTGIHKLFVPNFELKHMSIVELRQGCGQAKGAFAVSPTSAVFYANVFGSKEVAIPPELLSHARALMPAVENYIAPARLEPSQLPGPAPPLPGSELQGGFRSAAGANHDSHLEHDQAGGLHAGQ